jgi:hypothetical protein
MLFSRVAELHEEERAYLTECHKDRIGRLKEDLDKTQVKLKAVTQQYRDDQERWSNVREREDTKFSNLRKKLDLHVKNKRNLMLKIKALKERLEGKAPLMALQEQTVKVEAQVPQEPLTEQDISDKIHTLRQMIRGKYSYLVEIEAGLDVLGHAIKHELEEEVGTRELYPQFFGPLPARFAGHIRSHEWMMAALTVVYAERLTELCANRYSGDFPLDRCHFVGAIHGYFLKIFGTPVRASESLFDLVQTARAAAASGNPRAALFLKFIDCSTDYLDSVHLDFYCFCLGSFRVSSTQSSQMFEDVFNEETQTYELAHVSHHFAVDLARKILFAICEGEIAERYIDLMISALTLSEKDTEAQVGIDIVLEYLVELFRSEEKRMGEQLREQYEMDAMQYGGVVTLAQFQTLVLFSPRKVDNRLFTTMMASAFRRSTSRSIPIRSLLEEMHRSAMLVPFVFDRIDYDVVKHPDDANGVLIAELEFRRAEIDTLMFRLKKVDDTAFDTVLAVKNKLVQLLDSKRTGIMTEVANREFYGHFIAAYSE